MDRQFLLAPGPTPVPEEARLAMAKSLIHHRGQEFRVVFGEVRERLGWLFETEQPVLTVTASGTGTFEAAMINFTKRSDTIICIGGGKFGERWGEIGRAYGMNVVDLDVEWGEAVDPQQVADALDAHPDCAMVTLTASETSTGVLHPFEEVAEVIHDKSDALFAVDGITAVGVHRVPMDASGIDILVAGSQKAFGIPPGLGFVAASERAWERAADSDHPRYYFDLAREKKKQLDDQTAFTPGITQIIAAQVVLRMMVEEGRDALVARHQVNADATRAGVQALGLELLASRPANSVSAVLVPEGFSGPDVVRTMLDKHGATIAGGQAHLKPRLFRIGHIGFFDRSDILNALSALELTLEELGMDVERGRAVAAAQGVYADNLL
ncbi:alanine--glyoxylate aminotransferase family protein [Persicimonas caeni]|uniref:Alanine--glyoxylate aminotransferase family protein n=1 Tax=Persicimonas caeni TaxID=2292766 RepID=A0A4Y6Q3Z6_PERCE|nr:alanine--glyoxylate aminotransferase family protein [Persicimonas caeni]QDG54705.1 alanine--glyoxylate aminotransferase family protein [Persicimonas caeni]QED35926.1 alanine--glyoxylate aminotransferase family protein [Persicimonas caeni]